MNTQSKLKAKFVRGFTLIEILTYVGVMSAIVGALTGMIIAVYRYKTVVEDRVSVNEDLRLLVKSIRDDMYLGNQMQVDVSGQLIIQNTNESSTVRYYLTNNQVFRKLNNDTAIAVTSDETNVTQFLVEDVSSAAAGGAIRLSLGLANYPNGAFKPPISESLTFRISLKFL